MRVRGQLLELGAPLTVDDQRAMRRWRYPAPYDYYDERDSDADALQDPDPEYRAIRIEGELVGFYCTGADARVPGGAYDDDAVDVGIGMRPDWTGRGDGAAVLGALVDHLAAHGARRFRATVAAFNVRAIRVCAKAGFRFVDRFRATHDGREFVVMRHDLPA